MHTRATCPCFIKEVKLSLLPDAELVGFDHPDQHVTVHVNATTDIAAAHAPE